MSTTGNDGPALPERFQVAEEFENRIFAWLCKCTHIQATARTGFEHSIPDGQFRQIFRNCNNPLLDQYRYCPDFLIIAKTGKLVYIEVKKSLHIEKDAYRYYVHLDSVTQTWLVVESNGEVFWQRIKNIRFLDSAEHVKQFPQPFKVDPEGWILPKAGPGHSSCPFRVIDIASMDLLDMEAEE